MNTNQVLRTDQKLMKKIRQGREEKLRIEMYEIRNDREESRKRGEGD